MTIPEEILQRKNRLFACLQGHLSDPLRQYQERVKCAASMQYARGGACIPRGFYCPSPVRDLVIGNASRGKLLKRAPRVPPDYTYYFSESGQLSALCVPSELSGDASQMELITRAGNLEYGLMFQYSEKDDELWPITASLCEYRADGRITSYLRCILYGLSDDFASLADIPMHYEYEQYTYQDGRIRGVDFYQVASGPEYPAAVHNQYIFTSDEAGFFTEFAEAVPEGRTRYQDVLQRPYPVRIKRKAFGLPVWEEEQRS